jgi:ribonuclease P protein component
MLPAAQRLRRPSDFALAVRRGQRAGRPLLVVHVFSPSDDSASPAQAGLVVSRAVGGAVIRNRVKRRLRHLLATRMDALPRGARLVVRAQPGASTASSTALAADLDAALQRVLSRASA